MNSTKGVAKDNVTPLRHLRLRGENLSLFEYLVSKGADPLRQDRRGDTALGIAFARE